MNSRVRKTGILLLALVAVSMFFAGSAFAAKDTLIVANQYDAKTMDPQDSSDMGSAHVYVQLYDTLMKLDGKGIPVPNLAQKVDKVDDKTYRFTLRKGVKFHDGSELKASDVRFTLLRGIKEHPQTSYILAAIDPEGVKVDSDYVVTVRLKAPDTSFLSYMASYIGASILSENAVKKGGATYGTNPVGTGPYKFVSWAKGDKITLVRNDNYWGAKAKTKNVVIRAVAESATRPIELETGGVDIAYYLAPLDMKRVEDNAKLKLMRVKTTQITYIGFNCAKKPFSDPRVRQAIALAIDLKKLVPAVYRGVGFEGVSVIPPSVRYFDKSIKPKEFSVAKAKKLLADAGYPNGFETEIWTNERKDRVDTAQIVQSMLKEVGITVKVQVMEWGVYFDRIAQPDMQMHIVGWINTVMDPDYSVYGFLHSKANMNNMHYSDPETDKLLEEGRRVPDGKQREEIYKKIQRRVNEMRPILVTWTGEDLYGIRSNVKGFNPTATGFNNLSTIVVE